MASVRATILRIPGARPVIEQAYRARAAGTSWRLRRGIRRRDQRTLAKLSGRTDLKLNVGSSGNHLPGWLSIDIRPDEECFGMDASKPWPFASASAEAINSEHFIEHLTLPELQVYLGEAFRVLGPGGLIRTTTPNLTGLCEIFLSEDPAKLEVHRSHGYEAATHGQMFNNYFYSWDHRHIHDFETLSLMLGQAGFVDVRHESYGHSEHERVDGIDRHDPGDIAETVLCVDAVKPS